MHDMVRNVKTNRTRREEKSMTKRKVTRDAALKNNSTPTESMANVELTDETKSQEDMQRGANRNSKHGMQGDHKK